MAPALVTLLLVSWAGLAGTVVLGYLGHWDLVVPARHVYVAIPSFILGTFGHAMTMFYFIGTGKVVKEAVRDHRLEGDWLSEAHGFKMRVFPAALWAIGFIMVTSILGGAVDTGRLAPWIHGILGLATLAVGARAIVFEVVCVSANLQLMDRLDAVLAGRPAAEGAA